MLKRLLCVLTICLLASTAVLAQVTTSSLTGVIRDAAGGQNLAGASVTAIHQPSGTRYSTVSQTGGQFTISNMQSGGPYQVTITYVGYQQERQEEVYLQLGQPYIMNVSLNKSSGQLEQVVVSATGRSNLLNARRQGAATNIGRNEIQRLPSISRSINDFTRITPQANGTSIGGGNYRQNFITVDGSDFNNQFGIGTNLPANGSPISIDALDQISVNVTPYDVRQSGFVGSAINAVTRSGTNEFTGSVYTFWRSEQQQGDKVGNTTITRTPFEFRQYGARFGGPIIKNKLFFFFSYETENQPKQVQTFQASQPGVAGSQYGDAPNIARPTRAELDSFSSYLRKTYSYETGPYDNYSTQIERTKWLGRIDWNISQNHRLNIRYNQVEGGEPNPPSTSRSPLTGYAGAAGRTTNNALWFKNSNYFQGANFYSFAGELNSRFGRRINNTFRGTYTYQNDSRSSESASFPFVDILKDGTPFTSFGYEPFTFGNLRQVRTWSFVDNFTYNVNKHSITLGLQYERSNTINGFQRFATSYYTFASWDDFVTGKKPQDFAITYSLDSSGAQAFPKFEFDQKSAYIQDEITFSPKFRATFGLRADLVGYPDVTEIRTHPLVAALSFAGGQKINTGVLPSTAVMWSPRVGFNWDVYGDRSLQLRGGTGLFTGRVPFVWIVSQSGDAGLLQITTTAVGQANTPGPFNKDPKAYVPQNLPKAGTQIPSTISAMDPSFKFPQTWKSSFGIDKRLPWNMVLGIEAILNKDINTAVFTNPNLVDPTPLGVAGYPDNRLIYPDPVRTKFLNPLTAANAAVNPNTAVPNGDTRGTQAFNTIVMKNGDQGYYFSLTARLEKQFSKGLFASLAYTYSMADNLFDGSGDQPLSAWQGTANVNGSNYPTLGYAGFVVPHRVVAAISYRKEYLKHLATTISLFYEGANQGRFSYTYSADFNRDGTNFDLIYVPKDASEITFTPNTVNGVTYSAQQQSDLFFQYIEQDDYLRNRKGMYAERNGGLLPWRDQFDVRLAQDLFINLGKNRNTLQFTVDIFNVGNLLNSNWGTVQQVNASSILVPQNVASLTPGGTTRPTFRLATVNNRPVTESFRTRTDIISTYYMQFGLRYIFNN